MDILALLSEQTVSVALALSIMWFYNKLVTDTLTDRRELIESIRSDRKEWLDESDVYIKTLFDISNRNTQTMTELRMELHALKGEIQKFIFSSTERKPSTNEPGTD